MDKYDRNSPFNDLPLLPPPNEVENDFDILKKLLEIPDSKIIHLYQNKNEITWIRLLP